MRVYEGSREIVTDPFLGACEHERFQCRPHSCLVVRVNGLPLNPRLDLESRSPTGYECGYVGSGPRQLALAILADYLRDDWRACKLSWEFMHEVISRLPRDRAWRLTEEDIDEFLSRR